MPSLRFLLYGDSRSAQKALYDVERAAQRTGSTVRHQNRETESSFVAMERSTKRMRGAFVGMAAGVGLGGLAFGLKDAVQGALSLQAAQTQVGNSLAAVGQKGSAAKAAIRSITDQYESMGQRAGASTEQLLGGMARLIGVTHSVQRAQQGQSAALALARKTGMSYDAALQMIIQAEGGRTRGLQKYIGIIQPATAATDALRRSHAADVLAAQEQAKAMGKAGPMWLKQWEATHRLTAAQTAQASAANKQATAQQVVNKVIAYSAGAQESQAQRIADLRAHFRDLAANIGTALLPTLMKLVRGLTTLFGWLNHNRTVLYGLLGAIGAVTLVLTANKVVTEVLRAKTIALTAAKKLLGIASGQEAIAMEASTAAETASGTAAEVSAGQLTLFEVAEGEAAVTSGVLAAALDAIPILALIAAIGLLVLYVATHFKQVKRIIGDALHWIVGAAKDVWRWVKSNWPLLLAILTGPFGVAVYFVVKHFNDIKGAAKSVLSWLSGAWKTIEGIVTWPFKRAFKTIRGIWNDIVSDVRWVVGKVKAAFNFITSIPGKVAHAAGSLLDTATFGLLSAGGAVRPKYMALGGPSGTDTVPGWLTPGEYVLNRQAVSHVGMQQLNQMNRGAAAGPTHTEAHFVIEPGVTVVQMDSKAIARGVTHYTLRQAARGPSSLSGGSLMTGMTGAIDFQPGPGRAG